MPWKKSLSQNASYLWVPDDEAPEDVLLPTDAQPCKDDKSIRPVDHGQNPEVLLPLDVLADQRDEELRRQHWRGEKESGRPTRRGAASDGEEEVLLPTDCQS